MTQVRISRDKASEAAAVASQLCQVLHAAQQEGREPHIALTGGSMGSLVVSALVDAPERENVDWSTVSVWWGDERYLPAGDSDRNDVQNDEAGLGRLGLSQERVHRVAGPDTSPSAEAAADAYASAVREFGSGEFEVVLLGVGPDAHVASLFPHHPAQRTAGALAIAVHDSPKPPPDRVSLTFEALNRARRVWFVVAGADKADAVKAALMDGADRWDTPASGVSGSEATLWWLDAAAAEHIDPAS